MKKIILYITFLSLSNSALAQYRNDDRFAAEIGFGYAKPFGDLGYGTSAKYESYNSVNVGVHYKIYDFLGARFNYNYSEFQHLNYNIYGSKNHKVSLAATYDVLNAIGGIERPYRFKIKYEGLIHAGFGYGISKSDFDGNKDSGFNITFGIQPKAIFANNMYIFLNTEYAMNMQQERALDGITILENGSSSFLNFHFGVGYKFNN